MIEHIAGQLTSVTPTYAVIDVNGVGYGINITLNGYEAIKDSPNVKLLIHEVIREDTYALYGFADNAERDFFRLLISVSGIGPNTARVILSANPISELKSAIINGDATLLSKIKGIGAKTAQRLIVDLKDKVAKITDEGEIISSSNNKNKNEALLALDVLGFKKTDAQKVLDKLFTENPDLTTEVAVKKAIKLL